MALRARKLSGAFEKRAPALILALHLIGQKSRHFAAYWLRLQYINTIKSHLVILGKFT